MKKVINQIKHLAKYHFCKLQKQTWENETVVLKDIHISKLSYVRTNIKYINMYLDVTNLGKEMKQDPWEEIVK